MKIESQRLYARPFVMDDFAYFKKLHTNHETVKLMGKGLISEEEISERFARVLKSQEELGFSAWAIFERGSGEFVGRCGLVKIGTLVATQEDHSDKVEIGYAFLPDFWGCGYCQEIVPLFLEDGFKKLNLPEIFAKTAKENHKSRYLLTQKFSFTHHSDILVEGREAELFVLKPN
jgi:ribosomal-protein-alanine N-acetyltransferase